MLIWLYNTGGKEHNIALKRWRNILNLGCGSKKKTKNENNKETKGKILKSPTKTNKREMSWPHLYRAYDSGRCRKFRGLSHTCNVPTESHYGFVKTQSGEELIYQHLLTNCRHHLPHFLAVKHTCRWPVISTNKQTWQSHSGTLAGAVALQQHPESKNAKKIKETSSIIPIVKFYLKRLFFMIWKSQPPH